MKKNFGVIQMMLSFNDMGEKVSEKWNTGKDTFKERKINEGKVTAKRKLLVLFFSFDWLIDLACKPTQSNFMPRG